MKRLAYNDHAVRVGTKDGQPAYLTTSDIVRAAVKNIGAAGTGINLMELRARNRVIDASEKVQNVNGETFIEFEDADAKVLVACAKSASWTLVSSDLQKCLESIEALAEKRD